MMKNPENSGYNVPAERQKRLDSVLSSIIHTNSTTIRELTSQFNVSEMTIRRDIEALEGAGLVRSYRGGIVVAERHTRAAPPPFYSLSSAGSAHKEAKREIARLAAAFIRPGDVVFLDSGSTVGYILDYVDPMMEITVLCYSLNIFNLAAARKNTRVVFSGGVYHSDSQCCDSPEGVALLNRNRTSRAFISADGIRMDIGATTPGQYDIPIKIAAMTHSAHTYLVADSSKCGLVRTGHFADLTDFNTVITDNGFPSEMRELLREENIELVIAESVSARNDSSETGD